MTPAARATPWLPPLSTVVIAVVIGFISFALPIVPLRITGQAFMLVMLVRAFCYWPPMIAWIKAMPVPHRFVFAFLLGGMVAGHYSLTTHRCYPFVAWAIFPFEHTDNPVTCREFLATTQSGQSVRLLVEQVFPSITQFNPPDDNDSPAMTHLVQALAGTYNRLHAADPVRRVDLVRVAVKLHLAPGEKPTTCELLKQFPISSGASS